MSEERPSPPDALNDADSTKNAPTTAPLDSDAAPEETATEKERVDEDGLPIDRDPTIDDVRSKTGLHGKFAMGCVLLVVMLILAFWIIRSNLGG